MAIDTKSLTQLITKFRALQTKDAVSPESLGYLLQRIVDLLATAGTSDTVEKLQKLLDGFKTAGSAITSLVQGKTDRNHVYANIGKVSLTDGTTSTSSDVLFIQQATTERAGAMRAQQVTDLNAARKNVTELQKQMVEANNLIDTICVKLGLSGGGNGIIVNSQISCLVVNGELHVVGHANLVANGYVPYLFRCVRKRNQYEDKDVLPEDRKDYGPATKGWGVLGSIYTTRLVGSRVEISKNSRNHMCIKAISGYTSDPEHFICRGTNEDGEPTVGYGRTSICMIDHTDPKRKRRRMIKLRYGIGFAKPIYPGRAKITPANLASNLAEFSLIYNPDTDAWTFGK